MNAGSARHMGKAMAAMADKKVQMIRFEFGVHLFGFGLDFDFLSHACLEGGIFVSTNRVLKLSMCPLNDISLTTCKA